MCAKRNKEYLQADELWEATRKSQNAMEMDKYRSDLENILEQRKELEELAGQWISVMSNALGMEMYATAGRGNTGMMMDCPHPLFLGTDVFAKWKRDMRKNGFSIGFDYDQNAFGMSIGVIVTWVGGNKREIKE